MGVGDQSTDIRLLSLLHALRDGEEFVCETRRLLKSPSLDDLLWRQICNMGRELAPHNQLFDPGKRYLDHQADAADAEIEHGRRIVFDRRIEERRLAVRRANADRRDGERRMMELSWLGEQRRMSERRQYARRWTDQHEGDS
jgi:hypothetical protein